MIGDAGRLRHRLRQLEAKPSPDALASLREAVAASVERAQARARALPTPSYDEALPVSAKRADIAAAIAAHQVVIVCGETGSGKTTQIPKICLELKRGARGMIGCTQPRRIAARSVAARIAQELGEQVGKAVGYKVRFTDRVQEQTFVKVMTDGVLLAEIHGDRGLHAYDTLIVDEAHERSLNIDFLLGYLKQMLPRRPDLLVVITSAPIDAARFAAHFGQAPVIEVSGRTYPVELRYRPPRADDPEQGDIEDAVVRAIDELWLASGPGDVLVFLPGEREIKQTAESLRKHHPPGVEILPLFARLTVAEQDRVFQPGAAPRVVLATNVAETSLTVPRIRYVVDTGVARLNRYSVRSKVNLLQIEKISQASAKQRAGRCGRVQSGVCVRLYSEEDFAQRAEFTTPEVLRTSLAAVILRMQALKLGEIAAFPFLDAPGVKAIEAGYQLLAELGAINEARALTGIGHELAKLPVDPKIGRMLLAARDSACLSEVLVIAAALSTQDPRERPIDKRDAAAEKHRPFQDERSDFLGYLKLWQFYDEALKHKKSNRKLAQLCHENFLSYMRMREWRDVHGQLHALVAEMGMRVNASAATPEQVHRALLTGLLGHIGCKDPEADNYLGARDTKFWLTPDSVFSKQKPRWTMVAELTDTTRLYGRCAAKIEPDWIEAAAKHLVKRSYLDPHWEKRSAQVVASERVTLYGLTLVSDRRVHYGPIQPREAREIFIRGALVAGEFDTRAAFLKQNFQLIHDIQALENKARRQDVLVDDETIFAFYDALIPDNIYNGAAFEAWRKHAERERPLLLFLTREFLMRHAASHVTEALYPDTLALNELALPLGYRFDPGHALDGVSVSVPLAVLNQLNPSRLDWLVPGLLREKVTALLRGLPQRLRRAFVPLAERVTQFLEWSDGIERDSMSVSAAITQFAQRTLGVPITPEDWSTVELPAHLRMNVRVVDERGQELAIGRDVGELRAKLGAAAQSALRSQATGGLEREGITTWDFGDLPEQVELRHAGHTLLAYPGLEDCGASVALRLFDSPDKASRATRRGLVRLFRLELREPLRYLEKNLPHLKESTLRYGRILQPVHREKPSAEAGLEGIPHDYKEDVVYAICQEAFLASAEPLRNAREFAKRRDSGRTKLAAIANDYANLAHAVLTQHEQVHKQWAALSPGAFDWCRDDVAEQLRHLVHRGFLRRVPWAQLVHYPRYLKAVELRLGKIRQAPQRDRQSTAELAPLWRNYLAHAGQERISPALESFRWQIEELRVSLFAQELRTPAPVSSKRLQKRWDEIKNQI